MMGNMNNKNTNYRKVGGKVFVGSYSSKTIKTQLLTLAAREPWRSIIMGGLRILGYRDEPWARVVMYRETLKLISRLDHSALSACEISGESVLPQTELEFSLKHVSKSTWRKTKWQKNEKITPLKKKLLF